MERFPQSQSVTRMYGPDTVDHDHQYHAWIGDNTNHPFTFLWNVPIQSQDLWLPFPINSVIFRIGNITNLFSQFIGMLSQLRHLCGPDEGCLIQNRQHH